MGFNNFQEFKNYIDSKGLDYQIVLNKLYLDHLWNSLIYNKYKNKITIDEESIKQKILEDIGKEKKITSFLLNEIVFSVNNNQELEKKSKEITNNINQYGFEDTAKLYSLSDSSKFGGELDWISENQMSKKIKNEILKTPIGNHTKPIKIADGYMILFVKDIKQQEKKINFDKRLAQQINYERNNQFKQFSRLYFKKLMVNQKVE